MTRFSSEKNVTHEDYSIRMKIITDSYQKPIQMSSGRASITTPVEGRNSQSKRIAVRERRGSYVSSTTTDGSRRYSSRRMSRVLHQGRNTVTGVNTNNNATIRTTLVSSTPICNRNDDK